MTKRKVQNPRRKTTRKAAPRKKTTAVAKASNPRRRRRRAPAKKRPTRRRRKKNPSKGMNILIAVASGLVGGGVGVGASQLAEHLGKGTPTTRALAIGGGGLAVGLGVGAWFPSVGAGIVAGTSGAAAATYALGKPAEEKPTAGRLSPADSAASRPIGPGYRAPAMAGRVYADDLARVYADDLGQLDGVMALDPATGGLYRVR